MNFIKTSKHFTLATIIGLTAVSSLAVGSTTNATNDDNVSERQSGYCKGDPGYGISNIPLEKQLEDFLNNPELTPQQKEAARLKVEEAIYMRDNPVQTRVSYSTVTLNLTDYTQENKYYCGPATTRQTLGFLGNSWIYGGYTPPTQSTIASKIGTTTSGTEWYNIVNYINSFSFLTYKPNYVEVLPTSVAVMETGINSSLLAGVPPILQVYSTADPKILGYTTQGHYLNVSGIRTNNGKNQYEVTDPYRKLNDPNSAAKYYIDTDKAYEITQNHWAKHYMR